ncbi:hypothetical protein [Affinirhizobium pseudoryzae]|jgi:hypothetical protein|uniref:hypothetical protein n=1 Tax=Allorhizobium pseudoryzae TaxID=379684 RepID=UPI0013EBCB44|nr:hypothetical protein [Allorhizobium pseudoryzae]
MFPTAFTHSVTQFARTLSLPERIQHSPVRNLTLEGLRRRNTSLDAMFYDVKTITADEVFYISGCLAAEGAILIVPPTGGSPLTLCDTIDDFVIGGGRMIDTLVVAGVGSSALGSAALARNVADAIGKPVAAVISGYGLADVVTEALGGYFFFGTLNSVRHSFEVLDELFGRPQFGAATRLSAERLQERSLDTQTVRALLNDPRLAFSLLVGHSKGNLIISEALYSLVKDEHTQAEKLAARATLITLSARIAMPPMFKSVIDVMGEWDWFGELNSRRFLETDEIVPNALHHTNTDLPNHLPVTEVVQKIMARAINRTASNTNEPLPAEPELTTTAGPIPSPVAKAANLPLVVAEPPLPAPVLASPVVDQASVPVPQPVPQNAILQEAQPMATIDGAAAIAIEPVPPPPPADKPATARRASRSRKR